MYREQGKAGLCTTTFQENVIKKIKRTNFITESGNDFVWCVYKEYLTEITLAVGIFLFFSKNCLKP